MSMVYNEMLNKKKQAEKMAEMGKHRYEYDSDEDTEVSHYIISLTQVKYCVSFFPPELNRTLKS